MIGTVAKSLKKAVEYCNPQWTVEKVRDIDGYEPARNTVIIVFTGADYPENYSESTAVITNYPLIVNFQIVLIMKDATKEGFGAIDEMDALLKKLSAYDFSSAFVGVFRIENVGNDEIYGDFVKIVAETNILLTGY